MPNQLQICGMIMQSQGLGHSNLKIHWTMIQHNFPGFLCNLDHAKNKSLSAHKEIH